MKRRQIWQKKLRQGGSGLEFVLPSSGKVFDSKNLKLELGKLTEAIQMSVIGISKELTNTFYLERKLLTYEVLYVLCYILSFLMFPNDQHHFIFQESSNISKASSLYIAFSQKQ